MVPPHKNCVSLASACSQRVVHVRTQIGVFPIFLDFSNSSGLQLPKSQTKLTTQCSLMALKCGLIKIKRSAPSAINLLNGGHVYHVLSRSTSSSAFSLGCCGKRLYISSSRTPVSSPREPANSSTFLLQQISGMTVHDVAKTGFGIGTNELYDKY